MKKIKMFGLLFGLALMLCAFGTANAAILTFDDVPGAGAALPANYGGFTWDSNFYVEDQSSYNSDYGNSVTFPSAYNAVYNGYGVVTASIGGAAFDFNGAYFTTWADGNNFTSFSSNSVTVTGYNGLNTVGSVTMDLSADTFDYLTANFDNITSLTIANDGNDGKWWLMDNFTYNESTQVPEPATMLLLGLGLIGVAGVRRKIKQ